MDERIDYLALSRQMRADRSVKQKQARVLAAAERIQLASRLKL